MRIGYPCIPLCIDAKTTRSLILKNFSQEKFLNLTKENLRDLGKILRYNNDNNIKLFRISSDIIPLGSHPINNINWANIFREELKNLGSYITKENLRVSMHPGQYTVLNSNSSDVVKKAIKDLEYHTNFLDSLNLNYENKIILHLGGVYNNKPKAIRNFITNFQYLSESTKKRLVIENDERNYNIEDVLEVSKILKIPVIFDNLHHFFNNTSSLSLEEILNLVNLTWTKNDGSMKIHYSNSDPYKKNGAHSKFIYTKNFIEFYNILKNLNLDIDIMLEVKDKNISCLKVLDIIETIENKNNPKNTSLIQNYIEKYNFEIMERNFNFYNNFFLDINNFSSLLDFLSILDEELIKKINKQDFIKTLIFLKGLFKNKLTSREELQFKKYFNELHDKSDNQFLSNDPLCSKIKNYIYKLSKKYDICIIKNSYYFYH